MFASPSLVFICFSDAGWDIIGPTLNDIAWLHFKQVCDSFFLEIFVKDDKGFDRHGCRFCECVDFVLSSSGFCGDLCGNFGFAVSGRICCVLPRALLPRNSR